MFLKKGQFFIFAWGIIFLLAVLARWIPPSELILFQWLVLLMPFLTIISFILLIIAILKRCVNYPILIIYLIGFAYYWPLVFQWSPFSKPSELPSETIKVASYNVHGMQAEYGLSSLDRVSDFIFDEQIELLFLQEVPAEYSREGLLQVFKGMRSIVISEDEYDSDSKLVILSKYALDQGVTLSRVDRPHYALLAQLNYKNANITVVNCHLQTTNWNQSSTSSSSSMGSIIGKISDNYLRREIQVKSIHDTLQRINGPLLLAGDFNDSPGSYTYTKLLVGLADSFKKAGNGYGGTYRYLGGMYRIDYIFFDTQYFKALDYRTVDVNYSDHLPVLVDLMLKIK